MTIPATHRIMVDKINATNVKETFVDSDIPVNPPLSLIGSPTIVISNVTTKDNIVSFDYLCYTLYLSGKTECLASVQGKKSYILTDLFTNEPNISITAETITSITDNHVDFTIISTINYNNIVPTVISVNGFY